MTIGKIALLATAVCLSFTVVPASAQDARDCTCLTPYNAQAEKVGSVVSANGTVMVGFSNAAEGAGLEIGSRVDVGTNSTANISVGTRCNVTLSSNVSAVVDKLGDQLCVRVGNTPKVATFGGSGLNFSEVLFGTAVVGTIVGLAVGEDGKVPPPAPVNPPIIGTPVPPVSQ